jgi:hypothetical protein
MGNHRAFSFTELQLIERKLARKRVSLRIDVDWGAQYFMPVNTMFTDG